MINKYDKLHSKIMNRLNSSVVESNSEIVSMSDVIKSVRIELGLYHTILVNRQKRIIDKLNKSIGYSKFTPSFVSKKLPKVVDIKNSVNANGEVFVEIIFANGKNVILSGNSLDVQIVGIADKEIVDFVSKNNEIFTINLGTLIAFAQEYPGMEMNFGENCKNKF